MDYITEEQEPVSELTEETQAQEVEDGAEEQTTTEEQPVEQEMAPQSENDQSVTQTASTPVQHNHFKKL